MALLKFPTQLLPGSWRKENMNQNENKTEVPSSVEKFSLLRRPTVLPTAFMSVRSPSIGIFQWNYDCTNTSKGLDKDYLGVSPIYHRVLSCKGRRIYSMKEPDSMS